MAYGKFLGSNPDSDSISILGIAKEFGAGGATLQGSTHEFLLPAGRGVLSDLVQPRGIYLEPYAGKKLYIADSSTDKVYHYILNSSFDIYQGMVKQWEYSIPETSCQGIQFSPDGTRFFTVGDGFLAVKQYDLKTPWDLTDGITEYASLDLTVDPVFEFAPTDLFFSETGEKLYVVGTFSDNIVEYTMTTAFDISTAILESQFSIQGQVEFSSGIVVSPSGNRAYVVGFDPLNPGVSPILNYSLGVPFLTSSAQYESENSININQYEVNPHSLAIASTKVYVLGNSGLHQFSLKVNPVDNLSLSNFYKNGGIVPDNKYTLEIPEESDGLGNLNSISIRDFYFFQSQEYTVEGIEDSAVVFDIPIPPGAKHASAVLIGSGGNGVRVTSTSADFGFKPSGGGGGALVWFNDYPLEEDLKTLRVTINSILPTSIYNTNTDPNIRKTSLSYFNGVDYTTIAEAGNGGDGGGDGGDIIIPPETLSLVSSYGGGKGGTGGNGVWREWPDYSQSVKREGGGGGAGGYIDSGGDGARWVLNVESNTPPTYDLSYISPENSTSGGDGGIGGINIGEYGEGVLKYGINASSSFLGKPNSSPNWGGGARGKVDNSGDAVIPGAPGLVRVIFHYEGVRGFPGNNVGPLQESLEVPTEPPPALPILTSSVDSADEGSVVTISISAPDMIDGAEIGYNITGITDSDLSSGSLTGSFVISSGSGSQTFTLANDLFTEGPENFVISLESFLDSPPISILINDTSLNFENFDFSDPQFSESGSTVSLTGWTAEIEQVRLGIDDIGGFTSPTDPTPNPIGDGGAVSPGDGTLDPDMNYFWELLTEEDLINGSPAGRTCIRLYSSGNVNTEGDVSHGPYVISDDYIPIEAGTTIKFDWRAAAGGDAYDIFAYLLKDDGTYQILLNTTQAGTSGDTGWITVTDTVAQTGNYKFVFVSGTFDYSFGRLAGASLYVTNIRVT